MIFGLFNFLNTFVGFIFDLIPYWAYLRLALFSWLMLPQFSGAKWIFETFIKQALVDYDEQLKLLKGELHIPDEACEGEEVIVVEEVQSLEQQAEKAAIEAGLIAEPVGPSEEVLVEKKEEEPVDPPVVESVEKPDVDNGPELVEAVAE